MVRTRTAETWVNGSACCRSLLGPDCCSLPPADAAEALAAPPLASPELRCSRAGRAATAPSKDLSGESSLRDGFREQWSRIRSGLSAGAAEEITSLQSLYVAELQELHSAEAQLGGLLGELPSALETSALARQIGAYNTEIHSRREDLHRILRSCGANPREHSDQAMAALLLETRKLAHVTTPALMEAAVLASLQRVLHFKIAGYGTVAAYAKALALDDQASRLAEYSDRDKQFDVELSQTAQTVVNPKARTRSAASETSASAGASGTH